MKIIKKKPEPKVAGPETDLVFQVEDKLKRLILNEEGNYNLFVWAQRKEKPWKYVTVLTPEKAAEVLTNTGDTWTKIEGLSVLEKSQGVTE